MTPRTPQCEVFWALLSNFEHSGVLEDSKSPTLPSVGLHPTLGQIRVATIIPTPLAPLPFASLFVIVVAFHVIVTQHHGIDNLCNVQCVMHNNDISSFLL